MICKSCLWWFGWYWRELKVRKLVTKYWVHISAWLVSGGGEGGRNCIPYRGKKSGKSDIFPQLNCNPILFNLTCTFPTFFKTWRRNFPDFLKTFPNSLTRPHLFPLNIKILWLPSHHGLTDFFEISQVCKVWRIIKYFPKIFPKDFPPDKNLAWTQVSRR